jgi:hypothetical protein
VCGWFGRGRDRKEADCFVRGVRFEFGRTDRLGFGYREAGTKKIVFNASWGLCIIW